MSVANYIENYNKKRDNRIQENIKYAEEHPYPIDELNALDNGSPFKLLFNDNGKTNSQQNDVEVLAMNRNPDLYNRLKKGASTLRKLEQNEKLKSIDPSEELNARYSAVISGIAGSGLSITDLLNSESDDFTEAYSDILINAEIDGLDADNNIVQLAFKELNSSESDEAVNTLNDEDIVDEAIDGENPLNGETTERDEILEGEVTENTPGLEGELTLIDQLQNTSLGNIMEPAKLSEESRAELMSKSGYELVTEASNISNIDNSINDASSNDRSYLDKKEDSTSDVINNTSSDSTSDVINNTSSDSTPDVINNTSSDSTSDFINNTSSVSSSSSNSGEFSDDMDAYTANELAFLTKSNNPESESDVEESNSIINELNEDSSQAIGDNENSVIDEVMSETEVLKEKIGIDKRIAPINTPPPAEVAKPASPEGSDVTLTEVKSETAGSDNKTTTDNSSNVTNNEGNKSENNSAGYSMTDMSGVEARLRKIENLLSSPLEVKIVD